MKFKTKKEFALAVIEGRLYDKNGGYVEFDEKVINPFQYHSSGSGDSNDNMWEVTLSNYLSKTEWSRNAPVADKSLVEAWDNDDECMRVIGFYDKKNHFLFGHDGGRDGFNCDNYRLIEKSEWPEWAHDAFKKLKD